MSGEKAIHAILCIPGSDYPHPQKQITARVTDGTETKIFTFGPHCSRRHINEMIPRLWQDFHFDARRKKR